MRLLRALGSGLVGACTVTLINEMARRSIPHAPRLDVLGMRAIAKVMRMAHRDPPADEPLRGIALAGDIVSNTLYYSLVAAGSSGDTEERDDCCGGVWVRGAVLGAAAGIGAAVLPKPMGLGSQPDERAPATQLMSVAWYLAAGLAAAAAATFLFRDEERV